MFYSSLDRDVENLARKAVEYSKEAFKYESLLEEALIAVKKPPASSRFLSPGIIEYVGKPHSVFIGDLHGDFISLITVLNSTWSWIRNNEGVLVFLGDYIDRGDYQLETLIAVLLLKVEYPDNVVVLRGNHEPPEWLIPYPHDYPHQLRLTFREKAGELYRLSLKLFNSLPLIFLVKNKLIALHGGPPRRVLQHVDFNEVFEVGKETPTEDLLEDILWSDPIERDIDYIPSPRGAGILFGTKITQRTLSTAQVEFLIRGHEPVNGVKRVHGGRVITIFTSPLVYGLRCAGIIRLELDEKSGKQRLVEKCIEPQL